MKFILKCIEISLWPDLSSLKHLIDSKKKERETHAIHQCALFKKGFQLLPKYILCFTEKVF